jgi:hypothetical protein
MFFLLVSLAKGVNIVYPLKETTLCSIDPSCCSFNFHFVNFSSDLYFLPQNMPSLINI